MSDLGAVARDETRVSVAPRGRPARPALAGLSLLRPLPIAFVWLLLVYAWEAWAVGTPWLFTDELKYTELARAIASTGHPALRGEPISAHSLYVYLTAPAWLLGSTHAAYDTAKYIGVALMASTIFPTYALARLVVPRRPALFAAVGTTVVPAMSYSSLLLEEPLAYPYAALCFYLLVRALADRRRRSLALAGAAVLLAPLVRGELSVLIPVSLLAAGAVLWRAPRASAWRATWSAWDWAGAVALVVGIVVVFDDLVSHHSNSFMVATRTLKGRMLELGIWAGGSLAIGIGILPVVVALALLARPREEPRTRELQAFRSTLGASLLAFGFYTAIKAAYLSAVFARRVEERNLIYLAPLFFVATAIWLHRPRLRLAALAVSAAFVALLLVRTSYQLDWPYSDAPGFAIAALANRVFSWPTPTIRAALLGFLGFSVVLLLVPRLRGRPAWVRAATVLAAVFVLAWNATGELAAGASDRALASAFLANLPRPLDWVDRGSGGKPVLYLGQNIHDSNGIALDEFWNRSIERVWTLDGSAPGPGPTLTPDVVTPGGRLSNDPGFPYVLADTGVNVVGTPVAQRGPVRLYEVAPPLRLQNEVGCCISSDGWMGGDSSYSQFSGSRSGTVRVTLSRAGWGGKDVPGHVTVKLGGVRIDADHHVQLGKLRTIRRWTIHSHDVKTFALAAKPPFRVEIHIDPTFVPHELDPAQVDTRSLGAQVGFEWLPRAAQAR